MLGGGIASLRPPAGPPPGVGGPPPGVGMAVAKRDSVDAEGLQQVTGGEFTGLGLN